MNNQTLHEDYKVDLEVFEGPLDLLLYLVRRDEIDIYEISIERIATSYLAYLDMMKLLDLNIAGEFLVMAATLMLIKSRMILPVDAREGEVEDDEEEGVDPRLDLIRQLIEYKKFKDAAGRLMERELLQNERFLFGGEIQAPARDDREALPLGDIGLFDLLAAFQQVLERAPQEPLGHIDPIRWSVPDKMEDILQLTFRDKTVAFSRLFHAGSPRGEIIITFLALLELLRLRQVAVRQSAAFCEIEIMADEETPSADGVPSPPIIGGHEHVTA